MTVNHKYPPSTHSDNADMNNPNKPMGSTRIQTCIGTVHKKNASASMAINLSAFKNNDDHRLRGRIPTSECFVSDKCIRVDAIMTRSVTKKWDRDDTDSKTGMPNTLLNATMRLGQTDICGSVECQVEQCMVSN